MTKVSATNLDQYLGVEADMRTSLSKCSRDRFATIGPPEDPIAVPSTCS